MITAPPGISASLLAGISENDKELQTVKLSRSGLTEDDLHNLSHALLSNHTITELDLEDNDITADGALLLARGLASHRKLSALRLGLNPLGAEGMEHIANALRGHRLLCFSMNDAQVGDLGAIAFSRACPQCPLLKQIDLASNQIGIQGMHALSRALATLKSLVAVDLSQNQAGNSGACFLAQHLLAQTESLVSLNLDNNNIGNDGARAMGKALKENRSLTVLSLCANQIGATGADFLVSGLEQNRTLQTLDIRWNYVGIDQTDPIARKLEENRLRLLRGPQASSSASSFQFSQKGPETHRSNSSVELEGAEQIARALNESIKRDRKEWKEGDQVLEVNSTLSSLGGDWDISSARKLIPAQPSWTTEEEKKAATSWLYADSAKKSPLSALQDSVVTEDLLVQADSKAATKKQSDTETTDKSSLLKDVDCLQVKLNLFQEKMKRQSEDQLFLQSRMAAQLQSIEAVLGKLHLSTSK
eukprot:gene9073-10012_t